MIWALETEEAPLLEAVAREWLLETVQPGEDFACASYL
jgi:hypothetical protein